MSYMSHSKGSPGMHPRLANVNSSHKNKERALLQIVNENTRNIRHIARTSLGAVADNKHSSQTQQRLAELVQRESPHKL